MTKELRIVQKIQKNIKKTVGVLLLNEKIHTYNMNIYIELVFSMHHMF